ncbi:hypothetical protein ACFU5N_15985 [Streptomyces albidoflavus]
MRPPCPPPRRSTGPLCPWRIADGSAAERFTGDENQLDHFLTHPGQGSATALPFRCTICATELAYADAS